MAVFGDSELDVAEDGAGVGGSNVEEQVKVKVVLSILAVSYEESARESYIARDCKPQGYPWLRLYIAQISPRGYAATTSRYVGTTMEMGSERDRSMGGGSGSSSNGTVGGVEARVKGEMG